MLPTLLVPVDRIVGYDGGQIRRRSSKGFSEESLQRLADSLRQRGQNTPIFVCEFQKGGETFYELLAGERRTLAARIDGLTHLFGFIFPASTPRGQRRMIMVAENANREPTTAFDDAKQAWKDNHEDGLSIAQIALDMGISYQQLYRIFPLGGLSDRVIDELNRSEEFVSVPKALELLALKDEAAQLNAIRVWVRYQKEVKDGQWKDKPRSATGGRSPQAGGGHGSTARTTQPAASSGRGPVSQLRELAAGEGTASASTSSTGLTKRPRGLLDCAGPGAETTDGVSVDMKYNMSTLIRLVDVLGTAISSTNKLLSVTDAGLMALVAKDSGKCQTAVKRLRELSKIGPELAKRLNDLD